MIKERCYLVRRICTRKRKIHKNKSFNQLTIAWPYMRVDSYDLYTYCHILLFYILQKSLNNNQHFSFVRSNSTRKKISTLFFIKLLIKDTWEFYCIFYIIRNFNNTCNIYLRNKMNIFDIFKVRLLCIKNMRFWYSIIYKFLHFFLFVDVKKSLFSKYHRL